MTDNIKSLVERLRSGNSYCDAHIYEAADLIEQQAARMAILESERDELRSLHTSGCQRAYEYMGIEDDGEYRWKWVLLGIAQLVDKVSGLQDTLRQIASIENKMVGGDWDEIEEARKIANAALAASEPKNTGN